MEENSQVFNRCQHVHFCLPSVEQSSDANGSFWVDNDNGSIVLHITAANARSVLKGTDNQYIRTNLISREAIMNEFIKGVALNKALVDYVYSPSVDYYLSTFRSSP